MAISKVTDPANAVAAARHGTAVRCRQRSRIGFQIEDILRTKVDVGEVLRMRKSVLAEAYRDARPL
jgi:hypothetical protein